MTAYYNEFDPKAAAWLRELIKAGHIAPGIVDERSIEDVLPAELLGYTQCHFFAGIGVWSYALRRAGWADDRAIWTGSCPCQPFSAAGKGAGFDDERHLWPAWHHLIKECAPAVILGEQVASKDADPWIDLVCADLEAVDYAFGAVPFPSAGVGAPHIRDRLYWVAHADGGTGDQGRADIRGRADGGDAQSRARLSGSGMPDRLADTAGARLQGCELSGQRADAQRAPAERDGADGGMADAELQSGCPKYEFEQGRRTKGPDHIAELGGDGEECGPGPTNGHWQAADWLGCRDGKWRPVEPGTFPLAHGSPARVGRLRGYGNAINAEAATAWVEAVMDAA